MVKHVKVNTPVPKSTWMCSQIKANCPTKESMFWCTLNSGVEFLKPIPKSDIKCYKKMSISNPFSIFFLSLQSLFFARLTILLGPITHKRTNSRAIFPLFIISFSNKTHRRSADLCYVRKWRELLCDRAGSPLFAPSNVLFRTNPVSIPAALPGI